MRPRRESQRPFLPQHARHCPVLEAGSSLGFMVYAPLEPHEAFQVEYQGEGRYRFLYFLKVVGDKWQQIFTLDIAQPMGGVGMFKEKVTFGVPDPPLSHDEALTMARVFFVPEDLGTPAGGISLRGATGFQTPEGWDTVYLPVLNMVERPVPPMLVVRVETDWFPHESEFRYILQPGEGITGTHTMPIGQVVFVPREEVTLVDAAPEEVAEIRRRKDEYFRDKATQKLTTRYGLQYSPHYSQQSQARNPKGSRTPE
jgi:hypothetical protein